MSTWMLLRGLTRETRHWRTLPDALRAGPGFDRLLLIDLPGNGEFAYLRAPNAVAHMLDFIRRAAFQTGQPGPYCVLAMSLGGMVAMAWAQRHPAEVDRLVLINTSMRPFNRMHERLRPSAWPGLLGVAGALERRAARRARHSSADVQSRRQAGRGSRHVERGSPRRAGEPRQCAAAAVGGRRALLRRHCCAALSAAGSFVTR